MAKKTTKETIDAGFQTIASKAAAKVAAKIFKQNPDIKEAYVTADGTAFYGRNDAQNHANTLSNRDVFGFKRSAVQAATAKWGTSTTEPLPGEEQEAGDIGELTGEPINDESANTGE